MDAPIVVVEPSSVTRKIHEISLRREDFPCLSFVQGELALAELRRRPEIHPLLIVTELDVGQTLNGCTFIRSLRSISHLRETPIVVVTRRRGLIDRLMAGLAGANSYLTKPFTQHEFLSMLSLFISREVRDEGISLTLGGQNEQRRYSMPASTITTGSFRY